MGYVVTAFADSEDTGRRVEDALAALELCVAILRREDWPQVEDSAGQHVRLAGLLEDATAEAAERGAQGRLTGILSEYAEIARDGAWQRTYEIFDIATSPEHEQELLQAESRGESMLDVRRIEAEELRRLHPIVFRQGAWREAGRSWAWHFGVTVPEPVLDELARRRRGRFSAEELRAGVREVLTPPAELRAAWRAEWAARSSASPPAPAPGGGREGGRLRGSSR